LTTQKKSASEGESGVVWEVKEGWGYCSKGVCTQGDACAYLASTYKEYFGSEGGRSNIQRYSCQSDKKSGDTAGTSKPVGNYYTVQWDCLEEEHLCTDEKQKCCGEVKLPGENPYPTSK
jgi:hypothetical protein